jgi:hypothetical protein
LRCNLKIDRAFECIEAWRKAKKVPKKIFSGKSKIIFENEKKRGGGRDEREVEGSVRGRIKR